MMKDEEIAKIKFKSQYDDNIDDWSVPPFMLKAKEVTLPSLKKNGYDVMEQEKENRDLAIEGGGDTDGSDEYSPAKRNSLFSNTKNNMRTSQ